MLLHFSGTKDTNINNCWYCTLRWLGQAHLLKRHSAAAAGNRARKQLLPPITRNLARPLNGLFNMNLMCVERTAYLMLPLGGGALAQGR